MSFITRPSIIPAHSPSPTWGNIIWLIDVAHVVALSLARPWGCPGARTSGGCALGRIALPIPTQSVSSYPLCLVRNRHEYRISHTLHSYPSTHYSLIPAGQTPSHSTAHPLHLSHGSHSLCCHHTYATLPTPGPSARNRGRTVAAHRSAYHSAGDKGLTRTGARSRRISAHVAAYTSLPGCIRYEASTPSCRCALSVAPTFSAAACRPHKKCLKPCGLRLATMPRCLNPLLHYRLRHAPLCAPSLPRRAILPPTMGQRGVPSVSQATRGRHWLTHRPHYRASKIFVG